jgi:S1-C subfamily serine protease
VLWGLCLVNLLALIVLVAPERAPSPSPTQAAARADLATVTLFVQTLRSRPSKGTDKAPPAPAQGYGSGFFVQPDIVVTNAHVVKGVKAIRARLHNGEDVEASVIAVDEVADLAVVRTKRKGPHVLEFAPSGDVPIGSEVVAVGSPLAFANSLTVGVLSGRNRAMRSVAPDWYLQHDAAINPGSSGSPLLNAEGKVIGINAAVPDGDFSYAGISLAIPSEIAEPVVSELIAHEKIKRGRLGFVGRSIDFDIGGALGRPISSGVLIQSVDENEPAARVGLRPGDIVVEADGHAVKEPSNLIRLWALRREGAEMVLKVERSEGPVELKVVLGPQQRGQFSVASMMQSKDIVSEKDLRHGLSIDSDARGHFVISAVARESLGAIADVKVGDKVLAVGSTLLHTGSDPIGALAKGPPWLLLRQRDGRPPEYVIVGHQQFTLKAGSNARQPGEFSL